MTSKRRGARRERQLTRDLHDAGWSVIRVPSSGSATTRPLPDVLAMRGHPSEPRSIAIAAEVKANADRYTPLSTDEVHALEAFASRAGPACLPVVVTHPTYESWNAWTTYELRQRDKGYSIVQGMYPGTGLDELAEMVVQGVDQGGESERVRVGVGVGVESESESESDGGQRDE